MNSISRAVHKPVLTLVALLFLLGGCIQQASQQEEFRLPISINEAMASLINHSADPIWVAAWKNSRSDEDWRELEHLARQLQVGGALITIPGTGPVYTMWTGRTEWVEYAEELSAAAGRAVNAARSKDVKLIARAGELS